MGNSLQSKIIHFEKRNSLPIFGKILLWQRAAETKEWEKTKRNIRVRHPANSVKKKHKIKQPNRYLEFYTVELDVYNYNHITYSLLCYSTTPLIITMVVPAPEGPWMPRWWTYTLLHRATTITARRFCPCWFSPCCLNCLENQPPLLLLRGPCVGDKRHNWVTHFSSNSSLFQ